MESFDVVAISSDGAADDAGSGGTALDMDSVTREALNNLLAQFATGEGSSTVTSTGTTGSAEGWVSRCLRTSAACKPRFSSGLEVGSAIAGQLYFKAATL